MLRDLYSQQNVQGEIDPEFVSEAIGGGHYWGLNWRYPGIFHGEVDSPQLVREVVDTLDMWSFIESGYERLDAEDRMQVMSQAEPFGAHAAFPGFDGNHESQHLGVAYFLVRELERFDYLKGRDLNSHMHKVDAYRRMLTAFEPMRRALIGCDLKASQISTLLKMQIHPDNRND